jgi:hypothetical protein
LLAIPAVLDGASPEEAAKMVAWIVGRCGVIRFNEQGTDVSHQYSFSEYRPSADCRVGTSSIIAAQSPE